MTEEEIAKLIQEGNDEAFTKLVNEFRYMIYKLIHSYERNIGDFKCDHDDIFQEACIALYNACMNYDASQGTKFSSYAYIVIRSSVVNSIKKYVRICSGEYYSIDKNANADYRNSIATNYVFDNPVEYLKRRQQKNDLQDFLLSLPQEDLLIVDMRRDGKTYKQIAKTLGITTKRVDNRLRSIKRKFAKYMKENS